MPLQITMSHISLQPPPGNMSIQASTSFTQVQCNITFLKIHIDNLSFSLLSGFFDIHGKFLSSHPCATWKCVYKWLLRYSNKLTYISFHPILTSFLIWCVSVPWGYITKYTTYTQPCFLRLGSYQEPKIKKTRGEPIDPLIHNKWHRHRHYLKKGRGGGDYWGWWQPCSI